MRRVLRLYGKDGIGSATVHDVALCIRRARIADNQITTQRRMRQRQHPHDGAQPRPLSRQRTMWPHDMLTITC
ncbi:hypothetical protein [Komagataeibacter intermedius]|uniref:hypothetical protein n=1 Tax=Komagataeibacter intermedius TaxID=66229 RepID=UPI003B42B218